MCTLVVIFQPINGVYFLTVQICCYFPFPVLFAWCLQIRGEPGKIPLYLLYILSKIFHAPPCQFPGGNGKWSMLWHLQSNYDKNITFLISFTSDSEGLDIIYTEGISSPSLPRKHFFLHHSKSNWFILFSRWQSIKFTTFS